MVRCARYRVRVPGPFCPFVLKSWKRLYSEYQSDYESSSFVEFAFLSYEYFCEMSMVAS